MFGLLIIITSCLLPINNAEYYLPTIIWDPKNPLLQQQHWKEVVHVKLFDILTFVCANTKLSMAGSATKASYTHLNHNLYVKEISPDIENIQDACNTTGAKLITKCEEPSDLKEHKVYINPHQAKKGSPSFFHGKEYMFFATSDGTRKSLNNTENCTMVFRVHFNLKNEPRPDPECFLLGRKKVCEKKSVSKPKNDEVGNCTSPAVNIGEISNTTMEVTWQQPAGTNCNVTFYGVRCKECDSDTEILVSSSKRSVTLKNLKPSREYTISVKVYTCQERVTSTKQAVGTTLASMSDRPVSSPQTGEKGSIDRFSLGIGIIVGITIGVALSVGFIFAFWRYNKRPEKPERRGVSVSFISAFWCYNKRREKSGRREENEKDPNQNPTFGLSDDSEQEPVKLNVGYRESGRGWKLPDINEEVLSLQVSEA